MIKKYGKIAAAAAFLTAAGICYVILCREPEAVLPDGETWGMENSLGESKGFGAEGETGAAAAEEPVGEAAPADGKEPVEKAAPADGKEPVETSAAEVCLVHICGEVAEPGVYTLPEGSRIYQAVEAAGGFTAEASEDSLNLAAPVCDGMRVQVPSVGEAAELTAQELLSLTGQTTAESSGGAKTVNLNTAGVEELMTLSGVGLVRAEDIIRYRTEHGKFQKIEEIKNIPGIKDALFQKIKDSITV